MLKRNCHLFILTSLFLLLASLQATMAERTAIKETDRLQTELDSINLQIDFLKLKVEENKSRISSIEKSIGKKKKEIREVEKQIDRLNEKQIQVTEQTSILEKEISAGKKQIHELLKRFRARLVQLHKIKQGTLLSSIFSAKDLNSFLNRFQMVKYLLENDKDLLSELKKQNAKLLVASEELSKHQKQIDSIQKQLDSKRKKVDLQKASLQAMLKTVVLEKKLFLQKEKKLASAKSQLETEIDKIEQKRQSTAKTFEKELAATAPVTRKPEATKLSESAPKGAKIMGFIWPVTEDQIKSYQPSADAKNAALRIAVHGQCEIRASGRGKVLYKGDISGLGSVIILGHERGFSSVYANLDDIWVGMGQIVESGESIGRLFGGQKSLHFEIRFGGKKQQPDLYLPQLTKAISN
ncbi:MAG: hypothetical protein PWR01_2669 [Clostridiales bacterium]|jgi:septal ring factor EnvC (AmiA/AmiB activator)|nr:hypothetical protein [Clostridiales bacterium]MDN5281596.1 hypothetical protein [Candidatus Ozemobacter sp.]